MEHDKTNLVFIPYTSQSKSRVKDMDNVYCFLAKDMALNCSKKICNCRKKYDHIINDCPTYAIKKYQTPYTALL